MGLTHKSNLTKGLSCERARERVTDVFRYGVIQTSELGGNHLFVRIEPNKRNFLSTPPNKPTKLF